MKKHLLVFSLLTLAACGTVQPPVPLEQELAGKTGAERQQILVEECKKEARGRVKIKYLRRRFEDKSAEIRLINICEAMEARMQNKTTGDKMALMESCRKEANLSGISEVRQHRMNSVCDAIAKMMGN